MGKCSLCGESHYYCREPSPEQCQSSQDCRKSEEIRRNHQPFKYCKNWQNCETCNTIKEHVRRLRHIAGCCGNYNKKCNICNLLKSYDVTSRNVGTRMATKNLKAMQKIVQDIYKMQFKAPVGVKWKYR